MKNLYRILPSTFVCAFFTLSAFAQSNGKIAGKVSAAGTGTALSNASVRIVQLDRTIVADADGNYEFANLPAGRYTILAHESGFVDLARNVVLMAGAAAGGGDFRLSLVGVRAQVTVTETGSGQSTKRARRATDFSTSPETSSSREDASPIFSRFTDST